MARRKSRYHRKNADSQPSAASPEIDLPNDHGQLATPQAWTSSPLQQAFPAPVQTPPLQQRRDGYAPGRAHARLASQEASSVASNSQRFDGGRVDSGTALQGSGSQHSMSRTPEHLSTSAPMPPSYVPNSPPPTGELFPPPRPEPAASRREDGPPASNQIQASKSTSALPKYSEDDEPSGGCFGLFKRRRGEVPSTHEKSSLAQASHANAAVRPGGGGVVPGTDAPMSAVNAGDRRVLVECGRSKVALPVTPTTTPVDLIKGAVATVGERIDVRSAVLLEHYWTVGVQRPLRRYEHVRDVLNSWDTDRQNSLLLIDPGTGTSEAELGIAGVPKEKPGETSWLLHYSQTVGKWTKCMVHLKPDGQITAQRDPRKPNEQTNVCHLSDFDIYTPTQEKIKKKIKPPKRYCFAIKSQQKISMFESASNFVHFFSMADRNTADDFHAAIQGWRSWYLVNVMGEGKRAPTTEKAGHGGVSTGYAAHSGRHVESSDRQTVPLEQRTSSNMRKIPPKTLDRKAHLAEDEALANFAQRVSVDGARPSNGHGRPNAEGFADTGLLGRSYSQRHRDGLDKEPQRQTPSIAEPNGGHGGDDPPPSADQLRRQASTRRAQNTADLRRSGSVRDPDAHRGRTSTDLRRSNSTRAGAAVQHTRPLVDLTPQYREPPQHARKGRGHHPDQLGPGGLIEAATSPDDPVAAPPSSDWRGGANAPSPARSPHGPARSPSARKSAHRPLTHHQQQQPPPRATRSPDLNSPFTGEGLLASSQQGWGGGARGRGVMDGSHARGPMLDVSEQSQFAQGSLLDRVERERGPSGPTIDRQR